MSGRPINRTLRVLGIGFLMVGFTKRKQGLHDKIAGTLVFRRTPSIALDPTTDP